MRVFVLSIICIFFGQGAGASDNSIDGECSDPFYMYYLSENPENNFYGEARIVRAMRISRYQNRLNRLLVAYASELYEAHGLSGSDLRVRVHTQCLENPDLTLKEAAQEVLDQIDQSNFSQ